MRFLIAALWLTLGCACAHATGEGYFCLPDSQFTINNIRFLGKSKLVTRAFGEPLQIKRWYRKSDGNEGSYYVKDYIYKDVVFSIRDAKGRNDRIQKARITTPTITVGKTLHVGMTKSAVKKALRYPDEMKLEKSRFSADGCEGEYYCVTITFHFTKKGIVDQITVEYDSDSI